MTKDTPQTVLSSALSPVATCDVEALSAQLVADATYNMPAMPDERLLQGRIFDTRQKLVQTLLQTCVDNNAALETDDEEMSLLEMEDTWRDALPPLLLPPVRKIAHFSAWRTAFLSILGLLVGLALGQALSQSGDLLLLIQQHALSPEVTQKMTAMMPANMPTMPSAASMHQGLNIFCGLMGAMCIVWLSESMVSAMTLGRITFFRKVYKWKRFQRLCMITFVVVLGLSIARDFFGAKLGLLHLIQAFGLIFTSGQILPFFTNIYGWLIFFFCFSLLLKRPLSFDVEDFAEKLHMAVRQWWAGASLVGPLLYENMHLKNDPAKAAWKKVGIELYSLAGELPQARGQWLEERLRRLGIEVSREQGKLFWTDELAERYTPLGHIAVGDACFVDEPPLIEQGLLTRKGTVRKVRK